MWLRFLADVDIIDIYVPFEIATGIALFTLITILLVDDFLYCRRHALPAQTKGIYVALLEMFICCVIEFIVYAFKLWEHNFGNFLRVGMVLFITIVMGQFVNWWMRDQASVDRDRFINRSIQVAVASKNPSESIRLLLEYLGKELGGKRAYIYEDMGNERFKATYEWFVEGLDPMPKEGFTLRYDNCEGAFIQKMAAVGDNNAIGTIKSGANIMGFLGVNDVPEERMKGVDELMGIMSYFFAQFINQRKEQERMLYYSYHDPTSGAKNRSALREFTDNRIDYSQPFGYVVCEVAGLREISDNLRQENTEQIMRDTARCLMDAFGDDNVFSVSGEEFVCFGFENDETYFFNDVERAKKLLKERGCKTSMGAAYCANGTTDIMNVIRYTRELLAKDRISHRKK